jgi:hypothetical protein
MTALMLSGRVGIEEVLLLGVIVGTMAIADLSFR